MTMHLEVQGHSARAHRRDVAPRITGAAACGAVGVGVADDVGAGDAGTLEPTP